MTLPIFKNGDALFTVIVRDQEAKTNLTKWLNTSRSIQARVEDNRLQIFDHNTLNLFVVTWAHDWNSVTIWDNWSRRHMYFS